MMIRRIDGMGAATDRRMERSVQMGQTLYDNCKSGFQVGQMRSEQLGFAAGGSGVLTLSANCRDRQSLRARRMASLRLCVTMKRLSSPSSHRQSPRAPGRLSNRDVRRILNPSQRRCLRGRGMRRSLAWAARRVHREFRFNRELCLIAPGCVHESFEPVNASRFFSFRSCCRSFHGNTRDSREASRCDW